MSSRELLRTNLGPLLGHKLSVRVSEKAVFFGGLPSSWDFRPWD